MTDYSKSVIYKIHKDGICYIGSTTNEKRRKEDHKFSCNNENSEFYHLKVYQHIRENGGWDTWIFEVIEEYPCDNTEQLVERERYYYDILNHKLNTRQPSTTIEERKEQKAINGAKNYQDNKEEIAKKNAEHKEERNKYNSKWYEDNKKALNQSHICECGGRYTTTGSKTRHCRSKKHIAFIENNRNNT